MTTESTINPEQPTDRDDQLTETDQARLIAELKAALAAAEQDKAELVAERDRYSPYRSFPVWNTPDDVIAYLGQDHFEVLGELALATENKNRMKEGRPGLHLEDPVEYRRLVDRIIAQTAAEMVAEQSKWVPDDPEKILPERTVKMVPPSGGMRQIPLAITINNAAGSLNDPIERYRRKGFKLATPIRCMLRDCWLESAVDGRGKPLYGGFCSEFHRSILEGGARRERRYGQVTA